jgi:membrane protease YdiL (CAAX protease family)
VQNQDRYKSILVIVIGLLLLSLLFEKLQLDKAAIIIGTLALLSSFFAKWIEWAWFKLALGLGWVNSRILLTIIYFVFLLPIALVSRLFTKDPLKLKLRKEKTLYTQRDHLYTKEDLQNIW